MALDTRLIKQIVRRHRASKVRIFGSYLHGTQQNDSDIDLLIDLEPGRGLFDLVALKRELEEKIGKHFDVVPEGALSPYIKEDVLREARSLCSATRYISSTSSTLSIELSHIPRTAKTRSLKTQ